MSIFTDSRHPDAAIEEWVFAVWTPDASVGVISGHRLLGRTAWYWAALARVGRPLLHVTDFDVPVRNADPFIVKGEQLWAEHTRDAPMEQWSIGNETYASALENADDALGRAYGDPTPIAFDLEWYATGAPSELQDLAGADAGYEQHGVAHGAIEILGEPQLQLAEVPAHRWHRWTIPGPPDTATLHDTATPAPTESAKPADSPPSSRFEPVAFPVAVAHTGVRAPFAFPDGTRSDLVLTPAGWHRRGRHDPAR